VNCAETSEPIDLPFGLIVDSGGPKETRVQWYSPDGANVHNFNSICQVAPMYPATLCRELCKTAEPIYLPFELWTRNSTSSVIFARWRRCAHMGGHIGTAWRIKFEPSVCSGDAVLCQITITTNAQVTASKNSIAVETPHNASVDCYAVVTCAIIACNALQFLYAIIAGFQRVRKYSWGQSVAANDSVWWNHV